MWIRATGNETIKGNLTHTDCQEICPGLGMLAGEEQAGIKMVEEINGGLGETATLP